MSDSGSKALLKKRSLSVSVRDMVEFVLRSGDLAGDREFSGPSRALEGTRGHQRIQRSRPKEYKTEVTVSHQLDTSEFALTIRGRIDGVIDTGSTVLIEEIKTVRGARFGDPDPMHWAQAKVYAHLYLLPGQFDSVDIRLAYLDLESNRVTEHVQSFDRVELERFFVEISGRYVAWIAEQVVWWQTRDESIGGLEFPHSSFRAGQKELVGEVRRTCLNGGTLLAEAPTGIGKTLSVLFPAMAALRDGDLEKVFYLTAKTVGKRSAEGALDDMRKQGLRVRSLSLTARDKMCFGDRQPCEVRTCPYAIGYYDRVRDGVRDLLNREAMNASSIEEVARSRQICPHALALDASLWADVVVCDYNYVFDPNVHLKRFFSDGGGDYGFLVDEAHNLVDRAREMFSSELSRADIEALRDSVGSELPGCAKLLAKLLKRLTALARNGECQYDASGDRSTVTKEVPEDLLFLIRSIAKQLEEWLARNQPSLFRDAILGGYFRFLGFVRTADLYDSAYVTIIESRSRNLRLRLFCLDPSVRIQNVLKRGKSTVFFSGTLSPVEYFHQTLCGAAEQSIMQLPSPFPPENLRVLVAEQIATTFRQRESTYGTIAKSIAEMIQARRGNYLAFFPSYDYLNRVLERFRALDLNVTVQAQTPRMKENEREAFVRQFHEKQSNALVGFAVMGGIFGEGIDLVGEHLVGAVIVGVGLPQVCLERDLIRDYFQQTRGAGFDFAYTFPGMNRVLQAAGRVIRSELDRGIILLIDSRFAEARYRKLFPVWWRTKSLRSANELIDAAERFWNLEDSDES